MEKNVTVKELEFHVKGLQGNIDALEVELDMLKKENADLLARLNKAESVIKQKAQSCN